MWLRERELIGNAEGVGEYIMNRRREWPRRYANVGDVRGRGLMIGIELAVEAAPVVAACLEKGLLINCTQQTVLRLLPALTLADSEVDEGCDRLAEAIHQTVG